MALDDPLQWVVIAIVAVVFLMWGPKKIPELAKSIGLARKEFNDASVIASGKEIAPASPPVSNSPTFPPIPATGDPLIDTAKRLGIHTEGKNRQELSNAIVERSGT